MTDKTIMLLLAKDLARITSDMDEWAKRTDVFDSDSYQALAQRFWGVTDTLKRSAEEE